MNSMMGISIRTQMLLMNETLTPVSSNRKRLSGRRQRRLNSRSTTLVLSPPAWLKHGTLSSSSSSSELSSSSESSEHEHDEESSFSDSYMTDELESDDDDEVLAVLGDEPEFASFLYFRRLWCLCR